MFQSAEEAGSQKTLIRSESPAATPRNARVEEAVLDPNAFDAASKLLGEDSTLGASLKGVARSSPSPA